MYWGEIFHQALRETFSFEAFKRGLRDIVSYLLLYLVLSVLSAKGLELAGVISNLGWDIQSGLSVLGISFPLRLIGYMVGIPPKMDADKSKHISRLMRRLGFKGYDDITFSHYVAGETDEERRGRLGLGERPPQQLEISIANDGNARLLGAQVAIDSVDFISEEYANPAPDPPSRSLLWVVGYKPKNGRVDIAPSEIPVIRLASLEHQGVANFQWTLLDGLSKKAIVVWGRYIVTGRVTGAVRRGKSREDVDAIYFEAGFDFFGRGFENVVVRKLPKKRKR